MKLLFIILIVYQIVVDPVFLLPKPDPEELKSQPPPSPSNSLQSPGAIETSKTPTLTENEQHLPAQTVGQLPPANTGTAGVNNGFSTDKGQTIPIPNMEGPPSVPNPNPGTNQGFPIQIGQNILTSNIRGPSPNLSPPTSPDLHSEPSMGQSPPSCDHSGINPGDPLTNNGGALCPHGLNSPPPTQKIKTKSVGELIVGGMNCARKIDDSFMDQIQDDVAFILLGPQKACKNND